MSKEYLCDKTRMEDKIKTFSTFGDTGKGGITRLSLSEDALKARKEFCKRMEAIGAEIKTDDLGDIYAIFYGTEPSLPAIYSGSHVDSVKQGGNYDGTLGVLSAMEVAETIYANKIPHKHTIIITIWTNEEGARYEPAMMCSGIITGQFDKEKMMAEVAKDTGKGTFGEALEASGFKGEEKNRITKENCRAMFELHIEQGPVLEAEKKDIGIVEGVCGMVNYEITFKGQADHAGTTPMKFRKDALLAASRTILNMHNELDKLDDKLVYTTGKISAHPNIHTIIPDEVRVTLDARHKDPEVIKQVVDVLNNLPKECDGCSISAKPAWVRDTTLFDNELIQAVCDSTEKLGYSSKKMYSGAGHDAQYFSMMVPTTMIFVPSKDGHSHCELEFTPLENCWKGANVLLNAILEIDNK